MFSHKHTGFGQEMCPGHLIVAFAKCASQTWQRMSQWPFYRHISSNTLCPPFALILCCFQMLPSTSMTSFNPHSLLMSRLNGEGLNICLGFKDHAVPVLTKHLYLFFIMTSLIILGTFGACWLYLLPCQMRRQISKRVFFSRFNCRWRRGECYLQAGLQIGDDEVFDVD